jgi:hypothetical protein
MQTKIDVSALQVFDCRRLFLLPIKNIPQFDAFQCFKLVQLFQRYHEKDTVYNFRYTPKLIYQCQAVPMNGATTCS